MSITKNKKGFTLVELLAVIVILALIMSIAIVSMTGIMEDARYSTYVDTARSIINGVRVQLLAANELRGGTNYYVFEKTAIGNSGNLPFGGKIKYSQSGTRVGSSGIYKYITASCVATGVSWVKVVKDNETGKYDFSICIGVDNAVEGSRYMNETTEADLENKSLNWIKENSILQLTKEQMCNSHGQYANGACTCNSGYFGSRCEINCGHGNYSNGTCVCFTGYYSNIYGKCNTYCGGSNQIWTGSQCITCPSGTHWNGSDCR